MLILSKGQSAQFKFIFTDYDGSIYDPAGLATPVDVVVYVLRGESGGGPLIDGPYSLLNQDPEETGNRIERATSGEYTFHYTVPLSLFEYKYTVIARTVSDVQTINVSAPFQVKRSTTTLSPTSIVTPKSSIINYNPTYQQLNKANTSTILLVGHADGIQLNYPVKIDSIQHAIDLLNGDITSPLLKGVLDAYSCGARDIMICAAAPMMEYVEKYDNRLVDSTIFTFNDATPSSQNFYEKYYDRLEETYASIISLDFIDIIVPLETSIINTGGVDFITQLANYCSDFHNLTGNVQMGIIGSRSNGIKSSDITTLESNSLFTNKLTVINNITNQITSDKGRYVIPIYGELVYQHPQLKISYTSTAASAFAGMLASEQINKSLIRTRIPGAMSLYGSDLTFEEYERLEQLGINTLYRGKKTRRAVPFEVYITNEYTMANENSVFTKAAQMRLVSLVVSEIKGISLSNFDMINYDRIISETKLFLLGLKNKNIIFDFSLGIDTSEINSGKLIFEIELISSLGLKRVNFSLAAGPGA